MTLPELMHRTVDGVFAIDRDQKVVFWNKACEDITGIPAIEALGGACHELLKGQGSKGHPLCRPDCPLGSLSLGGPPPAPLCMRVTRTNGQRLQLSVGTLLVPSPSEGHWQVVHVIRPGRETLAEGILDSRNAAARRPGGSSPCAPSQPNVALLTCREREILRLLADGHSTRAICCSLHLSLATVRNHIQHLMEKLGVHSRLEAVAYARHHLAV